jgi:hypothetical protein
MAQQNDFFHDSASNSWIYTHRHFRKAFIMEIRGHAVKSNADKIRGFVIGSLSS